MSNYSSAIYFYTVNYSFSGLEFSLLGFLCLNFNVNSVLKISLGAFMSIILRIPYDCNCGFYFNLTTSYVNLWVE